MEPVVTPFQELLCIAVMVAANIGLLAVIVRMFVEMDKMDKKH